MKRTGNMTRLTGESPTTTVDSEWDISQPLVDITHLAYEDLKVPS
jgi:hypothetical protein